MESDEKVRVTRLLDAAGSGDSGAASALWSEVNQELRSMATGLLARERSGATLHLSSSTRLSLCACNARRISAMHVAPRMASLSFQTPCIPLAYRLMPLRRRWIAARSSWCSRIRSR
ncbi:MAG: hypothetical protein GY894_11990 [Planctomycetes bacterium]|nr:hypothetical protein [Planctomycetota bacterium]